MSENESGEAQLCRSWRDGPPVNVKAERTAPGTWGHGVQVCEIHGISKRERPKKQLTVDRQSKVSTSGTRGNIWSYELKGLSWFRERRHWLWLVYCSETSISTSELQRPARWPER